MSKRRNRSRLTRTDVNTICELQRKIDVYESYIFCLLHHSKKDTPPGQPFTIMRGTDMDDWVDMAVENIWKMKKELAALHDRDMEGKHG